MTLLAEGVCKVYLVEALRDAEGYTRESERRMSGIVNRQNRLGQAIKAHFSALPVPGAISKKVSTKMVLKAELRSGASLTIGCAKVKEGRAPGHFALYWMVSMTGGPIFEIMSATHLTTPRFARPFVFTSTSHDFPSRAHFEIGPDGDADAVAQAITFEVRKRALPLVEAFESVPARALDCVLKDAAGAVYNPFATSLILMHFAGQTERLREITEVAAAAKTFYDYADARDPQADIVEPLKRWFESHPPG